MINALKLSQSLTKIAICLMFVSTAWAQQSEAELWQAIATDGHIALMRHSTAPGSDDPPNFQLGDCTTQRNLSEGGRDLASQIGERFRANGIETAAVYSSPWCRCMDTAGLLNLGPVIELLSISSLYQNLPGQRSSERTPALQQWFAQQNFDEPIVLVTHQVNITHLTGEYAGEGDMVIVKVEDGALEVLGKIRAK